MGDIHWTEFVYSLGTFIVLTAYHIHWTWQVRRAPHATFLGVSKHLRRVWVKSVVTEKRDILSVQSLRNWIMAASFLASTAILIGLGILGFLFRPDHASVIPLDVGMIFSHTKSLATGKLMLLMVHFFFAFFSFTLSIRYMNQVNFMINVPMDCDPWISPDFIAHLLDTGMLHYTLGMRAYYLSVVVALWLFGPFWMFLGSLILVWVLYKLDHCCALDYSTVLHVPNPEWAGAESRMEKGPVL